MHCSPWELSLIHIYGKPLTEEKTVQIPAFKVVSVFDVSQTEGEPLPSIAVNELSGSVQDLSLIHICPMHQLTRYPPPCQ